MSIRNGCEIGEIYAREAAGKGEFGIFGTSVAATWLASGLGDAVKFLVDEDPVRDGRLHLGRPIPRPEQVPPTAVMYPRIRT